MNDPSRDSLIRQLRLSCDALDDWIAGWEQESSQGNLSQAGENMLSEAKIWREEALRAIRDLELGRPLSTRRRSLAKQLQFTLKWGPDITAP